MGVVALVGVATGDTVGDVWGVVTVLVVAGLLLLLLLVALVLLFLAPLFLMEEELVVRVGSSSISKNAANAMAATTVHIRIHTTRMARVLFPNIRYSLRTGFAGTAPPLSNKDVSSSMGTASATDLVPSGVIA